MTPEVNLPSKSDHIATEPSKPDQLLHDLKPPKKKELSVQEMYDKLVNRAYTP